MTTAVLVPYRGGEEHRERNWAWARDRYEQAGYEVIEGTSDAEAFSRTQGILDARSRTDAEVLIVADADVWCDGLPALVAATTNLGWSVPGMLHRLSPESTVKVLAGADWRGLPLSDDNPQDLHPYKVHEAGTLLALRSDVFDACPPDPRFVGWGQEDDAWSMALRAIVGPPSRVNADVVHLWHPPEPRKSRIVGNPDNAMLARRYRMVRHSRERMTALVEEARCRVATER